MTDDDDPARPTETRARWLLTTAPARPALAADEAARGQLATVPARPAPAAGEAARRQLATAPTRPAPVAGEATWTLPDPGQPRFAELDELGRGGMGRVVEAIDRTLGRTVAIKHSLASDAVSLARFEREALITARLQHPGIVPILDVGRSDDGQPYYVMRRIAGEPLDRRVVALPRVADRIALVPAILAAVDAAAYAHAQNIVHRDIKPSNILLGPFGEVLLIDWGLARQLGDAAPDGDAGPAAAGLTRAGHAYGTPGFMAPEQARGEPADRPADVYALGATLHFVVTGRVPFEGAAPTRMVELAAHGAAPDLTLLPRDVPVEIAAILTKALAPAAAERYSDAGELAADLRRFLAGQLVAAHSYTARERVARWIRRHRLVTGVTAAALVMLAAGAALSISQIVAERDQATSARRLAEDRAEQMLIDRSRSFLRTDPTSAIAALRDLPVASPRWPVAREIVRAAVAGGVERRLDRFDAIVRAAAFSPRGRLAAAGGLGDGSIRLYDHRTAAGRALVPHGALALDWLDDRTIVAVVSGDAGKSRVELVDADTGRTTPVAIDGYRRHVVAHGQAFVLVDGGRVVAVDARGATTDVAQDVAAIDAAGDRVAMLGHDRLAVLDRHGARHELAVALPGRILQIQISADGDRVAAFIYPGVVAWSLPSGQRTDWPSWPGRYDSLNGIAFAGSTLYGWSNVNNTLVAFEASGVMPRLPLAPSPNLPVRTARSGEAAVFANDDGAVAFAGPLGAVSIAHRALPISSLALDASGREVAIGTSDGEVLVLDLGAAIPASAPADPRDQLQAAGDGRVVVSTLFPPGLSLREVATDHRQELGPLGELPFALIDGDRVIAVSGLLPHRTLSVWTLDGAPWFRAGDIESLAVSDGLGGGLSLFYSTADGAVIEAPLAAPDRPRTLGRFAPQIRNGVRTPRILGFAAADRELVISLLDDGAWSTVTFDALGMHRLELGDHRPLSLHRTADGSRWFVEDRYLWRKPPDGPSVRARLDQRTQRLVELDGRLWAVGDTAAFELAPDGSVARAISAVGFASTTHAGFVLTSDAGIDVVATFANVHRVLRLPAAPLSAYASRDGRTVAALVVGPGSDHRIAVWRDPVPVRPEAVPAYLAALTNARLAPGADAVSWDAPRGP